MHGFALLWRVTGGWVKRSAGERVRGGSDCKDHSESHWGVTAHACCCAELNAALPGMVTGGARY